jgi:predicted lysophospholipase L1 biosynthesis ABC-type transport system permease subunit
MDTVAAVLAAFTPTQAAAHSVKKYDTAIRDHVAAVKSLCANQREVISANASQILQVNLTVSLLILANAPRTLTPRLTLSQFKPSSFSYYKHRAPHLISNEAPS